jgi:O-antigen/teichoic acid export membrane protein
MKSTTERPGQRSTTRVLISGTTWNALAQLTPVVVNIIMTPYLIHHLGVDRWGLIAFVTTIETILTSFDGGLTETTNRFFAVYAGTDDREKTTRTLITALMFIFCAGIVVSLAAWVVSPNVVHLIAMPHQYLSETIYYLRCVTVLIALGFARNTIAGVIAARQRFALISILNMLTYAIWVLGLIITVQGGWGLKGVAVTFLVQQGVATLVVIPTALRYLDFGSIGFLDWSGFRTLFSFSSKLQLSGLCLLFNAEFDSILIGTVISVRALAMYSAGAGLATQVSGIFANAMGPAGTLLARTYGAEGDGATRRTYLQIQRYWTVACNAIFAVALGGAYYAIVNWLGHDFVVGGIIATAMVIGQGTAIFAAVLSLYSVSVGQARIELNVGLVVVAVNVVLTSGFVFFGVIGVAVATVIAWMIASWYLLHAARQKIHPDLPSFLAGVSPIATSVTAAAVLGLEYVIHPYVPIGAIGLAASTGPCLIGLVVFAIVRFGPWNTILIAKRATQARTDGMQAVVRSIRVTIDSLIPDPVM